MDSKDEPTERLFTAIEKNDCAMAESAIKDGANLSAKKNGFPPLHYAGLYAREEIAILIIGSGANLHQEDDRLHKADEYLFGNAKDEYKKALRGERDKEVELKKPRISETMLFETPQEKKKPIKH